MSPHPPAPPPLDRQRIPVLAAGFILAWTLAPWEASAQVVGNAVPVTADNPRLALGMPPAIWSILPLMLALQVSSTAILIRLVRHRRLPAADTALLPAQSDAESVCDAARAIPESNDKVLTQIAGLRSVVDAIARRPAPSLEEPAATLARIEQNVDQRFDKLNGRLTELACYLKEQFAATAPAAPYVPPLAACGALPIDPFDMPTAVAPTRIAAPTAPETAAAFPLPLHLTIARGEQLCQELAHAAGGDGDGHGHDSLREHLDRFVADLAAAHLAGRPVDVLHDFLLPLDEKLRKRHWARTDTMLAELAAAAGLSLIPVATGDRLDSDRHEPDPPAAPGSRGQVGKIYRGAYAPAGQAKPTVKAQVSAA